MKIVKKEWCSAQEKDLVEFIAETNEIEGLPTTAIAVGSYCITPNGAYFLFEDGWKKFGGDEE